MSTYAAALAYRGLFALFPFLIFVLAIVNALDMPRPFEVLADWSRSGGTGRLPSAIRQWLVSQARTRVEGPAIIVAAAAAVWAVATGARVLRRGLDLAAGAVSTRGAWRRLAWSLIVAPAVGAGIITVLFLFIVTRRAFDVAAPALELSVTLLAMWNWIRFPAGLVLAVVIIVAIYQFAASTRPGIRPTLPGAAVAAVLWIVASLVFAFAIGGVWRYGGTYGSFSAAIVLLVYLYLAAAAVLYGAELNAVVAAERNNDQRQDGVCG